MDSRSQQKTMSDRLHSPSNFIYFYPQAVFACRFAVGSRGKFLPHLGIEYWASGTERRIIASIRLLLTL
jgi:hypothetical protein